MLDQILSWLPAILGFIAQVPVVGKYVAILVSVSVGLITGVTAFVAMWRGIVAFIQALSLIPGLGKLSGLALKLKASEDSIDGFASNKLLPILNRLSGISLPSKPPAP